VPRPATDAGDGGTDAAAPAALPATVLLVEDDPVVRDLISEVLESRRLRVLEAGSAEDALGLVERRQGRVDLLVSDVCLPGSGGGELARSLRLRDPSLRVLLMSGSSDRDRLRPLLADPTASFLPKPFDPNTLLERVLALLGSPAATDR
jgi:CheY-like chemotaxis protein